MAHEGICAGTWIRTTKPVPRTVDGLENLATLDVSDAKHPRLVYVQKSSSDSEAKQRPPSLAAQPQPQKTSPEKPGFNDSIHSILTAPRPRKVPKRIATGLFIKVQIIGFHASQRPRSPLADRDLLHHHLREIRFD